MSKWSKSRGRRYRKLLPLLQDVYNPDKFSWGLTSLVSTYKKNKKLPYIDKYGFERFSKNDTKYTDLEGFIHYFDKRGIELTIKPYYDPETNMWY